MAAADDDTPVSQDLQTFVDNVYALVTPEAMTDYDPGLCDELRKDLDLFAKFWASVQTSATEQANMELSIVRKIVGYVERACTWLLVPGVVRPTTTEQMTKWAIDVSRGAVCFTLPLDHIRKCLRVPRSNQKKIIKNPHIRTQMMMEQEKAYARWQKVHGALDWAQLWKMVPDPIREQITKLDDCNRDVHRDAKRRHLQQKRKSKAARNLRKQSLASTKTAPTPVAADAPVVKSTATKKRKHVPSESEASVSSSSSSSSEGEEENE